MPSGKRISFGGKAMRYLRAMVAVLALALSGCLASQQPLNPPQLVTAREADMAIQLFMQATIMMAKYYGFDTIRYEEVVERSRRRGFSTLPFMPPITRRATPAFVTSSLEQHLYDASTLTGDGASAKFRTWVGGRGGYKVLLKYYVTTGWRAAQIVCRNYLLGLDEQNRYLQFLQDELGIGFGLANAILAMADANGTLRTAFAISQNALDQSINTYQDYRFLPIVDREAARELVETAQNKYAMDFLKQIAGTELKDKPVPNASIKTGDDPDPKTDSSFFLFSDAVHVLNTIEYQCTRSGVRNLVAIALRGATQRLDVTGNAKTLQVTD